MWAAFPLLLLCLVALPAQALPEQTVAPLGVAASQTAPSGQIAPLGVKPVAAKPHPDHRVRQWSASYKGRTFYVIELPRCEHVEAIFSHEPGGETRRRAQQRFGGFATCTGSFHHPRTMDLADFLQKNGTIVSSATTGRWFFAVTADGHFTISDNYALLKGRPGVSAIALGQRLVPLHQDGFSKRFMAEVTERMALGLSADHVYLVQGKSDIWRLAAFMQQKLPVTIAINSDGGHVVRGKAPVHIVFRWRPTPPAAQQATGTLTSAPKAAPPKQSGGERQGWLGNRPRRTAVIPPEVPSPEAMLSSEIAERRENPRASRRVSTARARRPGAA